MALKNFVGEHPAAESTVSISDSGKRIELNSEKQEFKRQKIGSTVLAPV